MKKQNLNEEKITQKQNKKLLALNLSGTHEFPFEYK
jgi:hypothetical protein